MRKVLYLLNYAGKAGTERYVETLVKYLSDDGLVQPFFAYNEGGLLVERLEAMGVPCRQVTMRRRFDKQAARALADLCREWDIDLIHCHYLREHYTALLAKKYNKKIRVVYTNHFVLANDFITRLSNRWMDKRQDQMIAVCNKGKEQLIANGWSGERIQVIFNAVDPAAWAGERSESTLRAELGLDEDVFVTGASRVTIANPIIGPPEISFSGSALNPPAASISSLWFVPRRTLKLPGFSTASPLTVTTRSVSGLPLITALCIPIRVSTLSTMQPASAGSMDELIARFVTA